MCVVNSSQGKLKCILFIRVDKENSLESSLIDLATYMQISIYSYLSIQIILQTPFES